jgi:hypothetical protein
MLKRVFPILLLSLALAACATLGSGEQRTLSVTGSGSVSVPPDIVTVSLSVQTINDNVAQAVADNNRRAQRVQDAVSALSVAAEDIRTTYFYVTPQQHYDDFGNPTGEVTYYVDNTITVTLRQIDLLGNLLQAAVEAGANSIQAVSFSVEDPSQAEDEARQEAMEDARDRAEMLAAAAGATLGDPISITTNVYTPFSGEALYGAGVGGGGVPVSPGMTEVQVQVSVIYELK